MTTLVIILILLVLNGVFAMTEIALVSARKGRLRQLADGGNRGAQLALKLGENPERFLSTVQIGISLVGVLAGALGGANLSGRVTPVIARLDALAPQAEAIAFLVVVVSITYLSLIIGELVPKGLALRHPERIACLMARPMDWLSKIFRPAVWVLEWSTRLALRLAGQSGYARRAPTPEEVEVLVREGIVTGTVRPEESDMVAKVFDLRDMVAEEMMRPKPNVIFLRSSDGQERYWPQVAATDQTVFPVFETTRDEIAGMVSLRDLFANAAGETPKPLRDLLREPFFVSETQPALSLLETLRASPLGAALVADEFGTVRGLITLNDLVEEVVGDLQPNSALRKQPSLRETAPDTWLADGLIEIDPVMATIPGFNTLVEAEKEPFQTLAGYIVHRLDRLPVEGEKFMAGGFEFEVVDMDRQRIDKVSIRRTAEAEPTAPQSAS